MYIKTILLDIDGTLANSKKIITEKTRDALIVAEKAGIKLVLASGRPTNGLVKFAKELKMDEYGGYFVCYNGATVIEYPSNKALFSKCLNVKDAKEILKYLEDYDIRPMIAKDEYMYVRNVFDCFINYKNEKFNVMEYEARGNGYLLCEKKDLSEWIDFGPEKILTYGDPEYLQKHAANIKEKFNHLSVMFTSDFYLEFTAKGIDKTQALRESLLTLGYKAEEMMAFGDAQNDKSMIEFSGYGVAMGNASDELKKVAKEVTLSNDDDGIAYSLYKNLPELFN